MGVENGQQAAAMVEVPSHFKCPISLCLMTDPVSICTGITYDRASIKKWFDEGRRTCPVTMQGLDSHEVIPNRTLQRIIQSWCVANRFGGSEAPIASAAELRKSNGQEQQRQPMDLHDARMLVQQISSWSSSSARADAVKRLSKDLAKERKLFVKAGLGAVLVSVFSSLGSKKSSISPEEEDLQGQVLGLLAQLRSLDQECRKILVWPHNLSAMAWLLQRGDLHTRISAAAVLEELCCAEREARLVIGSTPGVFEGFVRLIRDDFRHRPAIRSSLRAVLAICPPMKNRIRLLESGAVAPLVELLIDSDKATTEAVLAVLECLCGCAEGRAEVSKHALAVPAVTKKLIKASDMATEYAIDVLWAICKWSPDEGVRKRMVEVGLFPKLFFFLQIGCNPRTKNKAGDLLKFLHRAYRECIEGRDNNTYLLTAAAA